MKTYEQIKAISENYTLQSTKIPCNPFSLCSRLQVTYKTKAQCIKDFGGRCPLETVPAIMCKKGMSNNPDNVIYIDESSKYWQFYMFHELAHHILEHETDGAEQEQEANLLACCLIAPPDKLPTYLKSATDLACFANIPIGRAEEYWRNLHPYKGKNFSHKFKIACTIAVVSIVCLTVGIALHASNLPLGQKTDILAQSTAAPTENPQNTYSITSGSVSINGTEYPLSMAVCRVKSDTEVFHKKDCSFVSGKTDLTRV